MPVQLRLLGDVEARTADRPVRLGHARQRAVLAVLAVDAGRSVPVDQLIDRVWDEAPPTNARNVVYSYIARLRCALADAGQVIQRRTGSYLLAVDPLSVDLHRFRHLLAKARATTDAQDAAVLFTRALALWSGEPFTGIDNPWLNTVRTGLAQEHFAAGLDLIDLRLRTGAHGDLLPELFTIAGANPLDERAAGQLMLALYRAGRPSDALHHYQDIRQRLAEELGTDPTPVLRQLHQRILTADPTLATPPPAISPSVSAATPAPTSVPRQLPPPPGLFTGRQTELAYLTDAARPGEALMITAIGGTGGIGKTWLALQWAHAHADEFPDGQLHVNLRGFDPSGQPTPPDTAVRGFLGALGVAPAAIPVEVDAQTALFRSLVANKRMLIVADNARDAEQVIPLLPGTPTCAVLVTSRHRLAGLATGYGARLLDLDVLSEPESHDLLGSYLGAERLAAEPDAVADLLASCAGLPLAIAIAAARAVHHPTFPLAVLVKELRDTPGRLDALDAGDQQTNARAVLSWSYRTRNPHCADGFRLLGLVPGPDVGAAGVAALTGLPAGPTAVLLRELETASLVQQHRPGRYRMHDLVRVYAAERVRQEVSPAVRAVAVRRLVDCYLHTAYHADQLLNPVRKRIPIDPPAAGVEAERLGDAAAALDWFDTEHSCLVAVQQLAAAHGLHTQVWQLAWALDTVAWRRAHLHDHVAGWQRGLLAGERLADPAVTTLAHMHLGRACARIDRHAEAVDHLVTALTQHTGDQHTKARMHFSLAWIWKERGDLARAVAHATYALRVFQLVGDQMWAAEAVNAVGWYHAHLGHHDQARGLCARALVLARRHHYAATEADSLDSLGYVALHTGQHNQAADYYRQALRLYRELGNAYQEADTLAGLGNVHAALGRCAEAKDWWYQAMRLYQAQHRTTDATRVERLLTAS